MLILCSIVMIQQHSSEQIAGCCLILFLFGLSLSLFESQGVKPARIVFYRDGVSEGQFAHVMAQEVRKTDSACAICMRKVVILPSQARD
jgi:eukaryotic translation initiation factor 2C